MAKAIYTARAHVTGGRQNGHGRTDDGHLEVDVRPPGGDAGTNPEQLFAVGYAACFGSAMEVVARRMKLEAADHEIDSAVELWPTEERGFQGSRSLLDIAHALDRRPGAGPGASSRPRTRSARTPTPRAATST